MTDDAWQQLLNTPYRQPRKVKVRKPDPTTPKSKLRYQQAHELGFNKVAKEAGYYFAPKMPDCRTANGLTQAIVKFLLWHNHRATRVMSSGRWIKDKYIPGTTRKGAADVSSTINGKSVMWEVKVGADQPSEFQLREQELERRAGGEYFFVRSFEEFLNIYDEQTS
jgi:hypothetical protein